MSGCRFPLPTGTQFAQVLQEAGLGWDAVQHLILTHYHGDHVGAMGEVMAEATNATVYAGAEDIPEIETTHTIQDVADGDEVFGLRSSPRPVTHWATSPCLIRWGHFSWRAMR